MMNQESIHKSRFLLNMQGLIKNCEGLKRFKARTIAVREPNLSTNCKLSLLLIFILISLIVGGCQRCQPHKTFTWTRIPNNPVFESSNSVQMNGIIAGQRGPMAIGHEQIGAGYKPIVWSSPDCVTWSILWQGSSGDGSMCNIVQGRNGLLISCGYTNDNCIALGSHGVIWTSSDNGSTWNRKLVGNAIFDVICMDYSCSRYLAVGCDLGAATSWISTDGINWIETPNDVQNLGRREYSGTENLAMRGVIRYSSDSQGTTAFSAAGFRHEVVPGSLQWIDKPLVWMSKDGVSWLKYELPINPQFISSTRANVVYSYGNGLLYAMGLEESASSAVAVWESTNNGEAWSRINDVSSFQGGVGSSINFAQGYVGGNRVYAAGSFGSKAAYWIVDPSGKWGYAPYDAFNTSPKQAINAFIASSPFPSQVAVGWVQKDASSSKTIAAVWCYTPTN